MTLSVRTGSNATQGDGEWHRSLVSAPRTNTRAWLGDEEVASSVRTGNTSQGDGELRQSTTNIGTKNTDNKARPGDGEVAPSVTTGTKTRHRLRQEGTRKLQGIPKYCAFISC